MKIMGHKTASCPTVTKPEGRASNHFQGCDWSVCNLLALSLVENLKKLHALKLWHALFYTNKNNEDYNLLMYDTMHNAMHNLQTSLHLLNWTEVNTMHAQ